VQPTLGFFWITVLIMFILYFYTFVKFYIKGLKDRSYWLTYIEMEKDIRKIVVAFILFVIMSYVALNIKGFHETVLKGGLLSLILLPPAFLYYRDEKNFLFV
jgi:hypothetical protein